MTRINLVDFLIENVTQFSDVLHPNLSFKNLKSDTNFFVTSRDSFLAHLTTNELIYALVQVQTKPCKKTVEDITFNAYGCVIDIDCEKIDKKKRPSLSDFVNRIVKRAPMIGDKHIIVLRNFDGIMKRFQMRFKSIFESSYLNSCFIVTSTRPNFIVVNLCDMLTRIQLPLLTTIQIEELAKCLIDDDHRETMKTDISKFCIQCEYDLYSILCIFDSKSKTYENMFIVAIDNLLKYLARSKSLHKVIEAIRICTNKLLYYSIDHGKLVHYILKSAFKHNKIRSIQSKVTIDFADFQHQILLSAKPIFVYEKLFIYLWQAFHR